MTIDFKDNDALQSLVTSDFGDWSGSFTIDQQSVSYTHLTLPPSDLV